jgi:hypothetical protein
MGARRGRHLLIELVVRFTLLVSGANIVTKSRTVSRTVSHPKGGEMAVAQCSAQQTPANSAKLRGPNQAPELGLCYFQGWPGTGSNCRPHDFQSRARTN